MRTTVTRRYSFESAHFLPLVHENHKCRRLHGHNYEIEITIALQQSDLDRGFVLDFWDLDLVVNPIIAEIDHRVLNDTEGLENPTAELIGRWFYEKVQDGLDDDPTCKAGVFVTKVRVYETKNCWADYEEE